MTYAPLRPRETVKVKPQASKPSPTRRRAVAEPNGDAEAEAHRLGAQFADHTERSGGDWPDWMTESLRAVPAQRESHHSLLKLAGSGEKLADRGLASPLANVRIHADTQASRWNEMLHAEAFTLENHVFLEPSIRTSSRHALLELLGHELTHVAQQASALGNIQRRSRTPEISAHFNFWRRREDASGALALLEAMSEVDFNDTLADMYRTSLIQHFFGGLEQAAQVRFIELVGARATHANKEGLFEAHPRLNSVEYNLIVFGRQHSGFYGPRGPLAPDSLGSLVSDKPLEPFSGVGPRGMSPSEAPMSMSEASRLGVEHAKLKLMGNRNDKQFVKYNRTDGFEMHYDWSNPIKGDLVGPDSWLGKLPASTRQDQARLLFQREIVTSTPGAYKGALPTRIQVIRAAAAAHKLNPEIVAAFILAEQRDQTLREDAADFKQLTWAENSEGSVGLGQVTAATARREDLFADLLSPTYRSDLKVEAGSTTVRIAKLLSSDEFNVFAVARKIRNLADVGADKDIKSPELSKARTWLGDLDLSLLKQHSALWHDDHIRILGSEYTSKPFDEDVSPGWGEFVFEAYRDIVHAKIF